MIAGTFTLITLFFFGGVQELSFIDRLENGVKQFVPDQDRSKEILSDLKASKGMMQDFNKDRNAKLKQFYKMNLDRDIHREDMQEFFDERMKERIHFQERMLEARMKVVAKIKQEEWEPITALADEPVQLVEEDEVNALFEKSIETISRTVKENYRQVQAIALVQNFQLRYNELGVKLKSLNARELELLINQNTSRNEFEAFMKDVNDLRGIAFTAFVDLHFDILDATTEAEWPKVMGAINKVIG